jgi:hypothetical protein
MTSNGLAPICLVTPLLFAFLASGLQGRGSSQAQQESPRDLVMFLTCQSDRPGKAPFLMGISSCGSATADYSAAKSLARWGTAAIPDIEAALNSIEQHGESSEFALGAEWLLAAYAQIQGSAAYPRLRRMMRDPALGFLRIDLDGAAAISLGLTSYLSSSREPARMFHCLRGPQPRDALDQLILAWQRDDRSWLEGSLGPAARAALDSLLKGRT